MIRNPLPAYVLALLAMLLLAARLNVMDAKDATLWFVEGVALLVALLTKAVGEREAPPRPPVDPKPTPPGAPVPARSPLDLRPPRDPGV